MNKKYESPKIQVISMEPDESLMDITQGFGDEGGYGLLSNGVDKMPTNIG